MRLSIFAILLSISAICFGQDPRPGDNIDEVTLNKMKEKLSVSTGESSQYFNQLDTIPITSPTHLKALPELLKESEELQRAKAQLEAAMKNNSEKVMLILSAYADPTKITGITPDRKSIISKK